jgi:hypothetical protein
MSDAASNPQDIMLTIPVGLTAATITRVNPKIGADEANALAVELHSIIAAYRNLFSVRAPGDGYEHRSQESDMVLTIWRTALNWWQQSDSVDTDQEDEGVWVMLGFEAVDPTDELYVRWNALCDRIDGGAGHVEA